MKLLFKSNCKGKKIDSNGIKISKTVISLKGGACKKMTILSDLEEKKDVFASLGFDSNKRLCLFYTYNQEKNFLKVYKHNKTKNYYVISISKNNQDALKPFLGSYEIGDVNIECFDKQILKAELIKQ